MPLVLPDPPPAGPRVILVQCSCGWTVEGGPGLIHPHLVDVKVCENIAEMVQHWRDGHQVQARHHARASIRRAAKALKKLTEQHRRGGDDDIMERGRTRQEEIRDRHRAERLADLGRKMGFRVETYDPFTDEWEEG